MISLKWIDGDVGMTIFSYGDWNYYALTDQSLFSGFKALIFPTKGTLGMMVLRGQFSEGGIKKALREEVEDVYFFSVARNRHEALKAKLWSIYKKNKSLAHYNASYHLWFVPHPRDYTLVNNSNRVVTQWMTELGCRVGGPGFFSTWD